MADRYWVGGTNTWNTTVGTKWATTSGGTGGASVPGAADRAIFDSASGSGTVTVSATFTSPQSIYFENFSGTIATGTNSITLAPNGSVRAVGNPAFTGTGALVPSTTGTTDIVYLRASGLNITLNSGCNVSFYGENYFDTFTTSGVTGTGTLTFGGSYSDPYYGNVAGTGLIVNAFLITFPITINVNAANANAFYLAGRANASTTKTILNLTGVPVFTGSRVTFQTLPGYNPVTGIITASLGTRAISTGGSGYDELTAPSFIEQGALYGSNDTLNIAISTSFFDFDCTNAYILSGSSNLYIFGSMHTPATGYTNSFTGPILISGAGATAALYAGGYSVGYGYTSLTGAVTLQSTFTGTFAGEFITTGTLSVDGGNFNATYCSCSAMQIRTASAKSFGITGTNSIDITGNAATVFTNSSSASTIQVYSPINISFTYSGSTGTRTINAGTSLGSSIGSNSLDFIFYGGGTITFGSSATTIHSLYLQNFTGTWSGIGAITLKGSGVPGGFGAAGTVPTITFSGGLILSPTSDITNAYMYIDTTNLTLGGSNYVSLPCSVTVGDTTYTGATYILNYIATGATTFIGGTIASSYVKTASFATSAGPSKVFATNAIVVVTNGSGTVFDASADSANTTSNYFSLIANTPLAGTTSVTVNQGQNSNLQVAVDVSGGASTAAFVTTAGDYYYTININSDSSRIISNVQRYIRYGLTVNSATASFAAGTAVTTFIGNTTGGQTVAFNNNTSLLMDFPITFGASVLAGNTDLPTTITNLNVGSTRTVTFNSANVNITGTANAGLVAVTYRTYANGVAIQNKIVGSKINLTGTGTVWDASNTGGSLSIPSALTINTTSTSTKTFAGGNLTYSAVTLTQSGNGALTITGNNTFAALTNSVSPATILIESGSTQTVTDASLNGTGITKRITIGSSSTTVGTLTKSGGGTIRAKYLSISNSTATPANTWYTNALTSAQGVNVSGWVFEIPDFNASGFTISYNGVATDLTTRYLKKTELIDRYPSLASYVGGKINPGLWGWGRGNLGVLGNGANVKYSSPIQIGTLTTWKQVSSINYALSIRTDGTLWAWGDGSAGQLGNASAGAAYSSPVQIGALTDWNQINAGAASFGIRTNGTLWSWGSNSSGILGRSLAVTLQYSSPVQIGALTNWKKIQSNGGSAVALTTAGTIFSWGDNTYGQLGRANIISYSSPVQVGALTTWSDIAVGEGFMYGLKTDGTLWSWGKNDLGQLGNSTTINYSSPIQVGALSDWKQISGGTWLGGAVKTDGTLWVWGWGAYGQMGNADVVSYSSPIQVGSLSSWKQALFPVGDMYCAWALKTDGTVWSWGRNNDGQLGINNVIDYSSPVQVGAINNWKSISGGYYAVFGILDGYQ